MGLGIYLDNLSEYEDTGEEVKEFIQYDLAPDFKSRSTIQTWILTNTDINILKWEGETLVDDSAHEIYISNGIPVEAKVTFSQNYNLMDEGTIDGIIRLAPGETAHFYATGLPRHKTTVAILRKGSQDTRKIDTQ